MSVASKIQPVERLTYWLAEPRTADTTMPSGYRSLLQALRFYEPVRTGEQYRGVRIKLAWLHRRRWTRSQADLPTTWHMLVGTVNAACAMQRDVLPTADRMPAPRALHPAGGTPTILQLSTGENIAVTARDWLAEVLYRMSLEETRFTPPTHRPVRMDDMRKTLENQLAVSIQQAFDRYPLPKLGVPQ